MSIIHRSLAHNYCNWLNSRMTCFIFMMHLFLKVAKFGIIGLEATITFISVSNSDIIWFSAGTPQYHRASVCRCEGNSHLVHKMWNIYHAYLRCHLQWQFCKCALKCLFIKAEMDLIGLSKGWKWGYQRHRCTHSFSCIEKTWTSSYKLMAFTSRSCQRRSHNAAVSQRQIYQITATGSAVGANGTISLLTIFV